MSYPRTSQSVLQAICAGATTTDAITQTTGMSRHAAWRAAAKLRQIGLISGMTRGEYSLTDAGRDWLESGRVVERRGPSERRTRTARGLRVRAWWLMRQLGRWTLPDLLTTLADGSQRTPQSNMLRYLNGLEAAGVVSRAKRTVPSARPGRGHVLWVLARDLGPQAPVLRDDRRELYDPNAGTTLPLDPQPTTPRPIDPETVTAHQETHHV